MIAAPAQDWNVFQQIFAEHWEGFKGLHPRYNQPYYDALVQKMLACGDPDKMGSIEYRCLHCGEGTHRVSMSCQSSLCLRCAKVSVDTWVSQVSKVLHEGVISRHIILTVPAMFRTTFYHNAAVLLSALMCCGVHPAQHTIGKAHTQKIESKHINLRTRIKRLVRRTICFSKTTTMHDLVVGLFINRYEFGVSV